MGMGNNQVFWVKVHLDKTATGEHVFRFEHPIQTGQQTTGGWMTLVATKPKSAGFGKLLEVQAFDEAAASAQAAEPALLKSSRCDLPFISTLRT
jgi:nitrate reductase (NAD(P)H)